MNGNYLLDTSVIIAALRQDQSVLEHLTNARSVFIPMMAVGELFYGAFRSREREKNEALIRKMIAVNTVLTGDKETGYWFGSVKDNLRRKGQPIPENDIWIAAMAMQYGLVVATRDKHFEFVEDLNVEMW